MHFSLYVEIKRSSLEVLVLEPAHVMILEVHPQRHEFIVWLHLHAHCQHHQEEVDPE